MCEFPHDRLILSQRMICHGFTKLMRDVACSFHGDNIRLGLWIAICHCYCTYYCYDDVTIDIDSHGSKVDIDMVYDMYVCIHTYTYVYIIMECYFGWKVRDSAVHAKFDSAVHAKSTHPYTRNRLSHTREINSAIHARRHMY